MSYVGWMVELSRALSGVCLCLCLCLCSCHHHWVLACGHCCCGCSCGCGHCCCCGHCCYCGCCCGGHQHQQVCCSGGGGGGGKDCDMSHIINKHMLNKQTTTFHCILFLQFPQDTAVSIPECPNCTGIIRHWNEKK